MRYLPHTPEEIKEILRFLKIEGIEDLFSCIPSGMRLNRDLDLPPPLSEPELLQLARKIGAMNRDGEEALSFLGGGAFHHHIPPLIPQILGRGEFLTSYTPYQAEISQGTLQAIYEFQTLICLLTGMEVANASLYDGACALAEAVLMAFRLMKGKRRKVILPDTVNPEYRAVVETYTKNSGIEIIPLPYDGKGLSAWDSLRDRGGEILCVVCQNPNFFGLLEEVDVAARICRERGALFVASIPDPISLGILKPPGEYGADIVTGEGQGFGLPLAFGGPYLGFMATKETFMRALPGRIAGKTVDARGEEGFILTLAAREQHIRRERATSNICTNEALCALAATLYLSLMGRQGLRHIALLNLHLAHLLKERMGAIPGISLPFSSPSFNEFVFRFEGDGEGLMEGLFRRGIVPGLPLWRFYPELEGCFLVCVTEMKGLKDMERLLTNLKEVAESIMKGTG